MAKTQQKSETIIKTFISAEEIDRAIMKLKRRITEVEDIKSKKLKCEDPQNRVVLTNIRKDLLEIYGEYSPEYKENHLIDFWHGGMGFNMDDFEIEIKYQEGIDPVIVILNGLIERLNEHKEYLVPKSNIVTEEKNVVLNSKKCFIVHGRENDAKETIARFISKIGLDPVILHEKPNSGKTIIEKFEDYSDAAFTIVILAPDDYGCLVSEYSDRETLKKRARQNVIFELGYFIGKINRNKVIAIIVDDIEIPSDLSGIIYIKMDNDDGWKIKLVRELRELGIQIKMDGLL
jgi:predicted nucleotide-binding protein